MPRLVAIQGAIQPNGAQPLYRHPADEQPVLVPFTDEVDKIRRRVETVLQQPINHALIQWYKTGTDYISVRTYPQPRRACGLCCVRQRRAAGPHG